MSAVTMMAKQAASRLGNLNLERLAASGLAKLDRPPAAAHAAADRLVLSQRDGDAPQDRQAAAAWAWLKGIGATVGTAAIAGLGIAALTGASMYGAPLAVAVALGILWVGSEATNLYVAARYGPYAGIGG